MRKIIYTTYVNSKEYSLYLSDEADFLKSCLKKRIPAIALIRNASSLPEFDIETSPDLGFFPWAAEDEASLLDDEVYMKDVIYRTCGIPKTVCFTQRLIIRELCENDAADVSALFEEGAKSGFVSPWRATPDETAVELREYNRYYYDMYEYGYLGIESKENPESEGHLIGIAGFSGISDLSLSSKKKDRNTNCRIIRKSTPGPDPSPLEAGYLISTSYRRQGYAFEAMSALLNCSFSRCHDIYIFTDKKNVAGNALAAKLTDNH
ncbi:MAG: GNAT family N-acetyltransferase [Lachnospiraceae bacterium]|nr:GNAT family N-acetyltransferase [Lachnospiraceae bacterium]